jgi:hypothetical protein
LQAVSDAKLRDPKGLLPQVAESASDYLFPIGLRNDLAQAQLVSMANPSYLSFHLALERGDRAVGLDTIDPYFECSDRELQNMASNSERA